MQELGDQMFPFDDGGGPEAVCPDFLQRREAVVLLRWVNTRAHVMPLRPNWIQIVAFSIIVMSP